MRICDRCGHPAVKESFKSRYDDAEYDLCQTCKPSFQEWLNEFRAGAENVTVLKPHRGPGRPRKKKADDQG